MNAEASALPPEASTDVLIEPLADPRDVRRAADALRLILAVLVLVVGLLLATLGHARVRRTERGLLDTTATLPASLGDALTAALQLVAVAMPAAVVVAAGVRRRFATVGKLLLAGAVGTATGALVTHVSLARSHPSGWPQLLTGRDGIAAVTFPPAAWLSGITAIVTVASAELPRRWRRALWWLTGLGALVEVIVGGLLPIDAVVAASVGISIGSTVLLLFGESPRRPSADQVAIALEECGIELTALKQLPSGEEGPAAFLATTREPSTLAVRVYSGDDRDRDLLARLSRWLLVRGPDDDRGGFTVESAVEHEMLAMAVAARAGARVPEPVVAYPIARRKGPRGALVAWKDVAGSRLDAVPPTPVSDATLADLWTSVSRLQQHRVAHRRLRTDNITVDGLGQAWLTGFVAAQLGATDRELAADVAELLVSLGLTIGPDRAASSGATGLGRPAVSAATAFLQPLGASGPTRAAVRDHDRQLVTTRGRLRPGGRPSLFADTRAAVARATGAAPAELEPMARFTWKRALSLAGAFAVVYLVLPQLANAGAAMRALGHADWWWVLAALPALFFAQACSTVLQLGAIPADLPFGPTYLVQFGRSFLNRVTPNNVGGMALGFRYLQKAGVDSGAASASVGLQQVVAVIAELLLVAVFFARTGRNTSVHLHLHVHQWVLVLVTSALVGCAMFGFTPRGRRFFHDKIWAFIRSAGTTIEEVARSPRHLALTVAGALGGPMVQVVAFWLCVNALGGELPFAQVGAVYLGGHLVASAAPVPGGLGALEAALIAGLSALGMPVGAATSAVLIYRLLTYWLTIPVGWLSLKAAEGRGYV
jgi:uncharacterized protein (TIRG00374 family)